MKTQTPPHQQDHDEVRSVVNEVEQLELKVTQLEEQLAQAQENEKRSLADYHNLSRRTQEERSKLVKLAGLSVIESLLEPLHHLDLATQQLKDAGLTMVYQQFVRALEDQGLIELKVMGQEFDPALMEVVGKEKADAKQAGKVVKVVKKGYSLNGEVVQHSKVMIGVSE
jgi:molecular chaperone GrpE